MGLVDKRLSWGAPRFGLGCVPGFVQELLGHSSVAVTLDTYSHVLPGMDDGLADTTDATPG